MTATASFLQMNTYQGKILSRAFFRIKPDTQAYLTNQIDHFEYLAKQFTQASAFDNPETLETVARDIHTQRVLLDMIKHWDKQSLGQVTPQELLTLMLNTASDMAMSIALSYHNDGKPDTFHAAAKRLIEIIYKTLEMADIPATRALFVRHR